MENEISVLKILPKVIQLLSQGSILGQLSLLPLLFSTAREAHSCPQKARHFFGWVKRLEEIWEISDLKQSKLGLEKQIQFEFMEMGVKGYSRYRKEH